MISVGLSVALFMPKNFSLLHGMLLGAMVGGTSTVAIFGILEGIEKSVDDISSGKVILTMESIISDPICIIASITLIKMIMLPNITLNDSIKNIFGTFLFSSLFGILIGLFWTRILDDIRESGLNYMLTLAVLLPSYILSERLIGEGGGAMTALTFGLAITNYRYIAEKVGMNENIRIDSKKLREFHEEVTFFIKSFFFVYIGMIVTLSIGNLIIGLTLVGLIMLIRYAISTTVGKIFSFSEKEQVLTRFIFAAGLPSFIMAQLPMIFDPAGEYFPNTGIYADICLPIVLGSVAYSAFIGSYMIKKKILRKNPENTIIEKIT
jgi:cell volume regulation protein A